MAMEVALEAMMVAKCMLTVGRVGQNPSCLPGQCAHRGMWRYAPAMRGLTRHSAYGAPCNRRHDLEQVPRAGIAMKTAGNLRDASREVRRRPAHRASDLRKQLLCRRRDRPGHHRKQLTGSHSDEREEMLGGFVFRFGFGGEFPEVLHLGIGIDLAHRTDLIFEFVFQLVF
jgi:hypothetical protein